MRYLLYLFFILCFSSCLTQKRAVYNYLEDIKDTAAKRSVYIAEPIIQKNDLLSIQISSISTDQKVDPMYNMSMAAGGGQNTQLMGYLVDVRGDIDMPRIGTVHAEGLTKSELEQTIKTRLKDVLMQPTVMIRFLNFRITVLGEVGSPGVLTVPTERLTILEAVGMAGGITEFGTIKNVRVLRENNGIRETGLLDLTSQSIFASRYYQLQQNDVILVDQNSYRLRQADQQRITQQVGFALSIITAATLIYSIFTRN
ncbi:MAG: polysaccharide export protein [Flaviaesturariibacter sp.]|nr:polysaccharide export protein [Flaviaesturariibacter sp.]